MSRTVQFVSARLHRLLARGRAIQLLLSGVGVGRGVCVGAGCEISLGVSPSRRGTIGLGAGTRVERGVILHPYGGSIATGENVHLGPYTIIYGHGGVVVDKDTLISMHCRILSSNHAVPPPEIIIRSQPDSLLPTRIGCDVWLGAGVTVVGGVSIGDGCVVGAGSVVTADLPPYCVAMGVPARVVRMRS